MQNGCGCPPDKNLSELMKQFKPPPPPGGRHDLWELQYCKWWGWNWVKKPFKNNQKQTFSKPPMDPCPCPRVKQEINKNTFKELCNCLCFKKPLINTCNYLDTYRTPSHSNTKINVNFSGYYTEEPANNNECNCACQVSRDIEPKEMSCRQCNIDDEENTISSTEESFEFLTIQHDCCLCGQEAPSHISQHKKTIDGYSQCCKLKTTDILVQTQESKKLMADKSVQCVCTYKKNNSTQCKTTAAKSKRKVKIYCCHGGGGCCCCCTKTSNLSQRQTFNSLPNGDINIYAAQEPVKLKRKFDLRNTFDLQKIDENKTFPSPEKIDTTDRETVTDFNVASKESNIEQYILSNSKGVPEDDNAGYLSCIPEEILGSKLMLEVMCETMLGSSTILNGINYNDEDKLQQKNADSNKKIDVYDKYKFLSVEDDRPKTRQNCDITTSELLKKYSHCSNDCNNNNRSEGDMCLTDALLKKIDEITLQSRENKERIEKVLDAIQVMEKLNEEKKDVVQKEEELKKSSEEKDKNVKKKKKVGSKSMLPVRKFDNKDA